MPCNDVENLTIDHQGRELVVRCPFSKLTAPDHKKIVCDLEAFKKCKEAASQQELDRKNPPPTVSRDIFSPL